MTEPLTQLERRVYHYMIDFLAENTYQPSIREIAKKFRIKSTKTVSDLLHSLANKGYIQRDESRSRGVRLLGFAASGSVQPVPYYGKVHAGEPALIPEHRAGYVTLCIDMPIFGERATVSELYVTEALDRVEADEPLLHSDVVLCPWCEDDHRIEGGALRLRAQPSR